MIKAPAGKKTRPTAEMVRESLFNIIRDELTGSYFLDLFAGSGAVGIEALSRGALGTVFIEQDKNCCQIIKDNLTSLKIPDNSACVMKADIMVPSTLTQKISTHSFKRETMSGRLFDIIFADPPYHLPDIQSLPQQILSANLLSENGVLILEHDRQTCFPDVVNNTLHKVRIKSYGDTVMSYFKKKHLEMEHM